MNYKSLISYPKPLPLLIIIPPKPSLWFLSPSSAQPILKNGIDIFGASTNSEALLLQVLAQPKYMTISPFQETPLHATTTVPTFNSFRFGVSVLGFGWCLAMYFKFSCLV